MDLPLCIALLRKATQSDCLVWLYYSAFLYENEKKKKKKKNEKKKKKKKKKKWKKKMKKKKHEIANK